MKDMDELIKVYVRTRADGCITDINSSIFIDSTAGWIQIDEGKGDRYAHAQGNYFEKPLTTDEGIYRYKLVNGSIVEKTEDEIQSEITSLPMPEPTMEERIEAMEAALLGLMGL